MLSTTPEDCFCECLLPPGSSTQCIPALLLSVHPPTVAIFGVDITGHKQRTNNTHNSMHSSLSELWGERSFSLNIKVTIDHFPIKKKNKTCRRLKLFPLQNLSTRNTSPQTFELLNTALPFLVWVRERMHRGILEPGHSGQSGVRTQF